MKTKLQSNVSNHRKNRLAATMIALCIFLGLPAQAAQQQETQAPCVMVKSNNKSGPFTFLPFLSLNAWMMHVVGKPNLFSLAVASTYGPTAVVNALSLASTEKSSAMKALALSGALASAGAMMYALSFIPQYTTMSYSDIGIDALICSVSLAGTLAYSWYCDKQKEVNESTDTPQTA